MEEARQEIIQLLDQVAGDVMVMEPGDLMAYGDVLVLLENLAESCRITGDQALTSTGSALRSHLEGLILGEVEDQSKGLDQLSEGVNLCQKFLRGDIGPASLGDFFKGLGTPSPQEAIPMDGPDGAEWEMETLPAPLDSPAPRREAPPEIQPAQESCLEPDAAAVLEADKELLEGFVGEALEHLETIEVNTLVLEDTPEDLEVLNAVFRPFHTIKGVAGFLNLKSINSLAHQLENLLDKARDHELIIDGVAIDLILAGVDLLRNMIRDVRDAMAEQRPLKNFDPTTVIDRLRTLLAKAEQLRQTNGPVPRLGEVLVERGILSSDAVERTLATQREKRPDRQLGELLVSEGVAEPAQVAEGLKTQRAMAGGRKMAAQEVKVDTDKLDNLLDMVGELVIAQSMVKANPIVSGSGDRKLLADVAQMARITSELQKNTMAMRMIPIKQTFQRMARVVRDTAKKQGKQVRLEMEGEWTEIDRNMVEKFYDPLVHMVRNSVDHGLEPPEVRVAAGKPAEGVVVLAAYHKGGNVCIEIRDDGAGLNRARIIEKAKSQGIIDDEEGMSEEDIYSLVMRPGFSTAAKITDISGRGVGMDVVQRTISDLRGKIQITSQPGQGTAFTISLPLTLAIIDGMVVRVGDDRFILPTVAVLESLRPSKEEYATVQGRGELVMIRGRLLPLIRLSRVVGVKCEFENPWECLVMVVEHHGHQRCLMVDHLLGRQEVVIKSLGEGLKGVKVVAGGAIMGDGRVGLILDVEGVFKFVDNR